MLVIQAPLDLLHSDDGVVLAVQLPPGHPVEKVLGIVFQQFLCGLEGDVVIQQIAPLVQHIVSAAHRQVLDGVARPEMIDGHIQSDGVVAPCGRDSDGDQRLTVVYVAAVGIGEDHPALRRHRQLIPGLRLIVIVAVQELVGGDQLTIQHRIDIGALDPGQGGALLEIICHPRPKGVFVHTLIGHIFHIIHGRGEDPVIFTELAVLIIGIAGHKVLAQGPGVVQQELLADHHAHDPHHDHEGQQPKDPKAAPPQAGAISLDVDALHTVTLLNHTGPFWLTGKTIPFERENR